MSDFKELAQELDSLLRLKISPIGFKLFRKTSEIPEDFEKIRIVCTLCQAIGMARYHEKAVVTTRDTATACAMGGASLGFYAPPPDVLDGTRNAGIWAEDTKATKKIASNRTFIPRGKFEAVGIAPLKMMSVEPDVVQIWGTPVQILALVYAHIWDGSDNLELNTNGHGASCYEALAVPYLTGKIRLAIADIGDRRFAYAADDEMIVGVPFAELENLTTKLKNSYKGAYKFPYAYNIQPIAAGALDRCKV
ncbi:MAG: DUF169 domain-containing protein [Dehalococcoidales bacterium]|nr:DUF169 domain-containing protein [Dehalococcoidales bacterium]